MHTTVYIHRPQGAELGGGIFDAILGIGGAVSGPVAAAVGVPVPWAGVIGAGAQAAIGLFSANQAGGPAKGTAQITAFGIKVNDALKQLLAILRAGQADLNLVKTQADQIRGYLNNPQMVYQPKSGNDLKALNEAKTEADGLVKQIKDQADIYIAQLTGAPAPGATTGTAQTGGTGTATAPATTAELTILGYPATTVLLVAGLGLGAFVILK